MVIWSVNEVFGFRAGDHAYLPTGELAVIKRIIATRYWLAGPDNTVYIYPAMYECRVKPVKMNFWKWSKWFFAPWRLTNIRKLSKPIPISRNPYRESQ